jgi:hypothetical protein
MKLLHRVSTGWEIFDFFFKENLLNTKTNIHLSYFIITYKFQVFKD